jgi:recombination protein RecA
MGFFVTGFPEVENAQSGESLPECASLNNVHSATRQSDFSVDPLAVEIDKLFGKGTILKFGRGIAERVSVIPTGLISLDAALGIGGLPCGRLTEIFGPESGGKTTLALQIIAQVQTANGTAVYIDADRTLDATYAHANGVDTSKLLVVRPNHAEQALELVRELVRRQIDIVVVDSTAALAPKDEFEGEVGDNFDGVKASLISQALRQIVGPLAESRTCLLFINQLRFKLSTVFGNSETTPGGVSIQHHASVRIDVRRVQIIKDGETAIGQCTRFKVVNNKLASPQRDTHADLLFARGYSQEADLLDYVIRQGLITLTQVHSSKENRAQNGAKALAIASQIYTFKGQCLGDNRQSACLFLRGNSEMKRQINRALRDQRGLPDFSFRKANSAGVGG